MPSIACCFSGHRIIPEEIKDIIKKRTSDEVRALYARGVKIFKAGGALGFDTLAALAVLELKNEFPDMRLELELIAKDQADGWSERDIGIYNYILEHADNIHYASPAYTRTAIFERNKNLVNGSQYCICFLTKKSGGTAYTVNYAVKCGLDITNISIGVNYVL